MDKLNSFANSLHAKYKNDIKVNTNSKAQLKINITDKIAHKIDDNKNYTKKDLKLSGQNLKSLINFKFEPKMNFDSKASAEDINIKNTRSASKNITQSKSKGIYSSFKKVNDFKRSKTLDLNENKGTDVKKSKLNVNTNTNTNTNNKSNSNINVNKNTYLPKSSFLLKKKLQFKQNEEKNNSTDNFNNSKTINRRNNFKSTDKKNIDTNENIQSSKILRSGNKIKSTENSLSNLDKESASSVKKNFTQKKESSASKLRPETPSTKKSKTESESTSRKLTGGRKFGESATESVSKSEPKSEAKSESKSVSKIPSNSKNENSNFKNDTSSKKSSRDTKIETPEINVTIIPKNNKKNNLKKTLSNVQSKVNQNLSKTKNKELPIANSSAISNATNKNKSNTSNNIKSIKIQKRTVKLKNENNKATEVKDPITILKSSGKGNFVRMNLKRKYNEKNLKKFKNTRKVKLDREKNIMKYKKNLLKNVDQKYLGKGKLGLDDEIEDNDEIINKSLNPSKTNSEFKNGKNPPSILDGVVQQLPHFSEGYYNNILEETKLLSSTKDVIEKVDLPKNEESVIPNPEIILEVSNIKMPRPGITPNRHLFTNKLQSALKSSLNKNVSLDTELRILSREFRHLLSVKRKETNQVNTNFVIENQPVEKKLNFNDGVKNEQVNSEMLIDQDVTKIKSDSDHDIKNSEKIDLHEDDLNEDMSQEEVEKLENDILLKVLEENFGFKYFLPAQLECIKNIFNNKNTLAILPPAGGKSLLFQLPALVSEGLTIVVSPLLALITDQITNLPQCLSGAGISSFTNYKQRNEIFEAIKMHKIKILFITPERFSIENFSEIDDISLICFDEASCVCPLSSSYRPTFASIQNIVKRLKPNALLFLTSNMTKLLEANLNQQYKIDCVVKEKILIPKNMKIFVTKEENKLQGLVRLLKTQQFKNIPTLIFCNFKRNVDKVTSYLNQSGLSASSYHSGKSDMDRQIIQTNFMNDKIKLLVCTSSFSMGISKKDIRLIVMFDMPNSIESFLQQAGRGGRDKKESFLHVILNDDDYFAQRNFIYLDNIEKKQIVKFLDIFINLINNKQGTSNSKSAKRNFSEAFENKPIFNSDTPLPKTISINFSNASEQSGIKKQTQLYLLLSLYNEILNQSNCMSNINEDNLIKFNCLGIGPSVISIRFYKSTSESLSEAEPNIKLILESAREYQGNFRFNTIDVCEKIGITHTDLINYLYNLQSRGEIGYECKEEGIFLSIEKVPDSFKDLINFMYEKMQFFINLNLKKLNASYVLMRKFAINSIDNLLNNVLKNEKPGPIKCMTLYSDYTQYESEFRLNFENYFNAEDSKCDISLAGDSSELGIILPIITVDSQRERTTIIKEIDDMIRKEVEQNVNISVLEIVNVLFGIFGADGKNMYLSNPLWSKYQQYDYPLIYDIVENELLKFKSEIYSNKSGANSKKMKV